MFLGRSTGLRSSKESAERGCGTCGGAYHHRRVEFAQELIARRRQNGSEQCGGDQPPVVPRRC